MILSLRTDSPDAEIYVHSPEGELLAEKKWLADRQLTGTLLDAMQTLLREQGGTWKRLTGVIVYKGPGSFTGLRIGAAVANALADSRGIPIVATTGETWLQDGLERIKAGETDTIALPEYGAPANVTMPSR